MSELSSLFCKVKITKSQLDKFLNSPPEKPELNDNWLKWWDSRKMYSKMPLTSKLLRFYDDNNSNEEILNGWISYQEAMAFSDYDETTEEWHWGIMFFSENYLEMLPMFAFIISLEKYVSESPENRAIVFPFFWGDNGVHVYIHFEEGKAILSATVQTTYDISPEMLTYTKEYLNKKWDDLTKDMDLD
ncbi:hypothetical protein [Flavobacterium phragmitis]|uniref:Uncharacterized protein n=1 Tax=Flavobacterium phragmitis TaxID=739143 RepID=A0A1I1S2Y1_9FLAO|nr:hypothetical protein [Flavobacterium phragmitis]SFD38898.1 hypothetical protein SAMN05216297_107205 [Flavobacterium phragmitis]